MSIATRVRTRPAGRVSQTLETLAAAYREANPGRDCRWVYDPKTKPELSNVMSRTAEGYSKVLPSELGNLNMPGLDLEEREVRVADVILMGVDERLRQELMRDRANLAVEQAKTIDRNYYSAIEAAGAGLDDRHKPRPRGRSVIEEREHTYDVEQRTGEEG